MEQHVIAAELSATGAQELLAAAASAHLAYNAEDGTPRVVPVRIFWTGTEFVISTATTSPKVAALKARPDVALSIDGGDTPEQVRALSVRGRVGGRRDRRRPGARVPRRSAQVDGRRGGRQVREELP
jgi:pyridoxamine 5'-phosphate oxidase-like protein